jgi:bifunctional UDP-N-acetylglucosamine pyrophosphorylase/glucosamine-1-phosphate N-acetyltransferase
MKLGIAVLAAGQGTRMRSDIPKVLHQLGGRPLLAHVLDAAHVIGADRVCVVYGHGGERVREALSAYGCRWAEQAKQMGTGHALQQAMPEMDGMDRVLVLYGDVPLIGPATLQRLISSTGDAALGVLTAFLSDPTGYGRIVRDGRGRVLGVVEQKDASEAELEIQEAHTGFLVADCTWLADWLGRLRNDNAQGEYYLTDVIGLAARHGVEVATSQPDCLEEVSGINDRVQLAVLERYYQRRQAEALMRSGVTLADPARFDLRGQLTTGRDITIDVNAVIEGKVCLGDGVRIGPNCVLKDCSLGPGTEIFANCVIDSADIGAAARIGPFSRIRPDTVLADHVHVGNFVEIKKSRVGNGSKVNHLSYVGDSEVGSGVNVGAGTITCNYDGANKHRTVIGDSAFIGSNTALVAPVDVGAGATIGAGSVITREAPPDKLTVARGRQVTIDGWQRPVKKLK